MKIIAIDPGTENSSWVVFDGKKVLQSGDQSNLLLRAMLWQGCSRQLRLHDAILVIEKVESFGMAVGKEVFETVFWSGRFAEAWKGTYARIGRKEVKLHLCGSTRAKDSNIRQALIDKLGPVGTKKNPGPCYGISKHLWAALAVAVTFAETNKEFFPG